VLVVNKMTRHTLDAMETYLLEYQQACAIWALRKFFFLCISTGGTLPLVWCLRDYETALYASKFVFFGVFLVFNLFSLLGHFQIWLKED
jgi:hypothetical protein